MNIDIRYISLEEMQFIKMYALALKRNFDEFASALQLMRTEVGVKCPVRAALLGRQLQEMQADFEHMLAKLADQYRPKTRTLPAYPTTEDLVRLLQISFFKLVEPSDDMHQPPDDKGWFSGHPLEWEKTWQKVHHTDKPADNPVTALMGAFLSMLGEQFHYNLKNITGFPYKKLPPFTSNMHEDYEAYDDDEDDEDDNNDPDYFDED